MSRVTLVFTNDEGDSAALHCTRLRCTASQVQVGDFIACPYVGFIHVYNVRTEVRIAYIADGEDREHIYRVSDTLEVARPLDQ